MINPIIHNLSILFQIIIYWYTPTWVIISVHGTLQYANLGHFPSANKAAGRIDCTLRCLCCGLLGGSSMTQSWGEGICGIRHEQTMRSAIYQQHISRIVVIFKFVFFIQYLDVICAWVLIDSTGSFQAHFRAGAVAQGPERAEQHAAEARSSVVSGFHGSMGSQSWMPWTQT